MWVMIEAKREHQIPGAGFMGGCKLPDVGAGNVFSSSIRATSSLNCWAIFLAPCMYIF